MTQVSIKVNDAYLRDVVAELQLAPGAIKRLRRAAAWDTAKQTKTHTSTLIRSAVKIKKKDVDKHIEANRQGEGAKVSLKESKRLPLRDFGARQTKRGVTYQIANVGGVTQGKGQSVTTTRKGSRGRVPDAFIIEKNTKLGKPTRMGKVANFGNHVFRRVGKKRLPIRKLWAVSAWGVVVKNDMVQPIAAKAEDDLENNIRRRVNLEVLRRTGKVNT